VVPLFALANAGVVLDARGAVGRLGEPGGWGVAVGLVVGKLAGVVGASLVVMWLGLGRCPRYGRSAPVGAGGAGRDRLHRGAVRDLAHGSVPGIGVDPARVAILAASLVAGAGGRGDIVPAQPGCGRHP
jgi:Na+/H+ antiporter 1